MLGLRMPPTQALASALNQMGQLPLMPPNVRGWPGGRMWINTSTLFIRYNTGVWLAGGRGSGADAVGSQRGFARGAAGPAGAERRISIPNANRRSRRRLWMRWVKRLIQRPIDADKKQVLVNVLADGVNTDSVRKVVQLIVSMPEYQLC